MTCWTFRSILVLVGTLGISATHVAAQTTAAKDKDCWTVELAIPLSEIQLPAVSAAAGPWRINLTRFRTARKAQGEAKASFAEDTALAPTNDTSSHVPDMFGYAWVEAAGGKLPAKP
jgi:hypothetical protein